MKLTLVIAIVLVVFVIFIFLRTSPPRSFPAWRCRVAARHVHGDVLLEYSLDNLSLMALTLSVGFVVDDAIVMLENIVRHMEMGKSPMQAAYDGSKEIAFTILSMTVSLVAVFIPVLFMGGVVGRLLREFAVTITAAILVSGFMSISLTPMLCSRFLRPPREERHGWLYAHSSASSTPGVMSTTSPWARCCDSGRSRWPCRSCCSPRPPTCSWSCRRVSCQVRTRDDSTSTPRPRRGSVSRTWCSTS